MILKAPSNPEILQRNFFLTQGNTAGIFIEATAKACAFPFMQSLSLSFIKPPNKLCGRSPLIQDSQNKLEPASSNIQVCIYLPRGSGACVFNSKAFLYSLNKQHLLLFFVGIAILVFLLMIKSYGTSYIG